MKNFHKVGEVKTETVPGSKVPADMKRTSERQTDEDYTNLTDFIRDEKNNKTYKREDMLGKGGFSRVFRVVEVNGKNELESLANKIISKTMLNRCSNTKGKVEKEIRIHRMLSHVNVVRIMEAFEDEHFMHIILENCSMGSLMDVLKRRGTIEEMEARFYVYHIIQGVQYIHREGYLHCDLKLSNILLSRDMVVKIGDFGLVCRIEESQPGHMKGTPNYIAPEVLAKLGHGVKADIWSIGCMFFALLCGVPPFQTLSLEATYEKIKAGDYLVPNSVSEEAKSLIDSMLALNVEYRGHLELDGAACDRYLLAHPFFTRYPMPRKMPTCAATMDTSQWMFNFFDLEIPDNRMISSLSENFLSPEEASMASALDEATRVMPIIDDRAVQGSFSHPDQQVPNQARQQRRRSKPFLERVLNNLGRCLNSQSEIEPDCHDVIPVFIKKWVDYTNTNGFGVQLIDETVVVQFNDRSRIAESGDMIEMVDARNKMEYVNRQQRITDENIRTKMKNLDYITAYMNNQVPESTADLDFNFYTMVHTSSNYRISQIKRWRRSETSVVVELSNHLVQINLEQESIKVVLWEDDQTREMFLTEMNDSIINTYSLATLIQMGSPQSLLQVIGRSMEELIPLMRRRNSRPSLERAE